MASIDDEEKGQASVFETDLAARLAHESSPGSSQVPGPEPEPDSPTAETLKSSRTSSSATLFERSGNRLKSCLSRLRVLVTRGPARVAPDSDDTDTNSEDADSDDDGFNIRQLNVAPNGYPRTATFLDSDENFMLYRRFGYLQSRLLLEKQDDLRRLELKLDIMDSADEDEGGGDLLRTRLHQNEDFMAERRTLMEQIEKKWLEYSSLVLAASQMTALNKPTNTEHTSVKRWMDMEQPLIGDDAGFINEKEDLITLRPGREYAWLDAAVEKILQKLHMEVIANLFRSRDTRRKMATSSHITYFTRQRIAHLVNTIMVLMVLILLIVPVYVLLRLTDGDQGQQQQQQQLGGATPAGTETLCWAYCAVLVVFIGNIGGGRGGARAAS
ncbi:hypothetical protein PV04_04787 [Phialophora macrospora]|uniref:DUF6594 domain-containing protein n=1 Tax=Phialophora macrospora TaxID=1851006 RepID=A0A0D2E3E8_9EURO|nr:hypothetical protein PV04_04787 [Phialophora macrospora]